MGIDIIADKVKFVICYNLETMLLHYLILQPGQHLSTGQPNLEQFDTADEVIARMIELGFNPDDYIPKDEEEDMWLETI